MTNTELYNAVIAAFTLVAFSDGHISTPELSRLVKYADQETSFKGISLEKIQDDVSDLRKSLDADFAKGKIRALEQIEKIKADAKARELVINIARIALISDDKVLESEEVILADIHAALGLTEE